MNPLRLVTYIMIIMVAGSVGAQIDGYTCTNAYVDCSDISESPDITVVLHDFEGRPGDTVWLPVSLSAVADTIEAFVIMIEWDDTYLQPLFLPGDDVFVEFALTGDFATIAEDFFVQVSQTPADEGAIMALFNLGGPGPWLSLPPGDHGVIFRLPFVVDLLMPLGATAEFGYSAVNEYVVTDEALLEAFCADCRRTNMAIKYDCDYPVYDTISTNPLIIDTLIETGSCSAVSYPQGVGGTFSVVDQGGRVYLSGVDGLIDGTIPIMSGPVTWHFAYQNYDADQKVRGVSNGFAITIKGTATWNATHGQEFLFDPTEAFSYWLEDEQFWDGQWLDIVGFHGIAYDSILPMMPASYHGPGVYITIDVDNNEYYAGDTICIDSSFYQPTGHWNWFFYPNDYNWPPAWDGPHCYELSLLTPPLVWVDPPVSYTGDYTDLVVLDYEAFSSETSVLTFTNEGAIGTVATTGDNTCRFTYQPTIADTGASLVAVLGVSDGVNPLVTTETSLNFTIPPPAWVVAPVSYSGDRCDLVVLDYEAYSSETSVLTFTNEGTIGTVTTTGDNTCRFTYQPTLEHIGTLHAVLGVSDGVGPVVTTETLLHISSQDVGFSGGCHQWIPMGAGSTACVTVTVHYEGCDPLTVELGPVWPDDPVGTVYLTDNDDSSWTLCFDSDLMGDAGVLYILTINLTDGLSGTSCDALFDVGSFEPPEVQIEKTHNTLQGLHEVVDVTWNKGSEEMGGFDFLIAYDASALGLQAAIPGPPFYDPAPDGCGWEYFTYRQGPFGNCGNACPSGLVRVFGLAETNNGANHPSCFLPDSLPATIFTLDLLVSNDRTLECMYVPIRFFWDDCGDNTVAAVTGDTLYVSDHVYDFEGTDITDSTWGFPTYFGVQPECLNPDPDKPSAIQLIDFLNGGVDIVCADSIDDRGDINLNGTVNEIADAVLFSNYFVKGIGVFNVNYQGQVAATDVNADGLTLSVADLVYLIRVIVGDANPYPKLTPVAAAYSFVDGVLSVDSRMGAAFVLFDGEVMPRLLADNMEMRYHFDGSETRVLVSNIELGASFDGELLYAEGDLLSVEMATYDGAPVVFKSLPSEWGLYQNYPNPFNPRTTIAFALPNGGDYELTVYNVVGQEVASFTGVADAGEISSVEFDAADMASGVYFYRLDAEGRSQSRKMVLMK